MKKKLLIFGIFLCLVITAICALFIFTAEKHFDGQYFDDGKIVIANNVVIYDENSSPFKILESTNDYLIVDKFEGFDENSIINAGVTKTTPGGLLCHVDKTEKVENGYKIYTIPAALTEAILKCNISGSGYVKDDSEIVVDEYYSKDQKVIDILQKAYAFEAHDRNDIKKESIKYKDFLKADLQIYTDFTLQIYDGDIYLRYTLNFYIPVSIDFDKTWKAELEVWKNKIPKFINIQAGPVPVIFTIDFGVNVEAELKVRLAAQNITSILDKTVGFEYSSGEGFKGINEDNGHEFEVGLDDKEAHFGINSKLLFPKLWIEIKLYGLVGLNGSAALEVDAEMNLEVVGNNVDGYDQAIQLPFTDKRFKGDYFLKIYTPIEISLSCIFKEVNIFDTKIKIDGEALFSSDGIVLYEDTQSWGEVEDLFSLPSNIVGKYVYKMGDRVIAYLIIRDDGTAYATNVQAFIPVDYYFTEYDEVIPLSNNRYRFIDSDSTVSGITFCPLPDMVLEYHPDEDYWDYWLSDPSVLKEKLIRE